MRVRWTRTALCDLESLHSFIREDNPDAAGKFIERILEGIDLLPRHPEMGRPGRVARIREFVVPPYVIVYRIRRELISIVAIIHFARRWPDSF